MSKIIWEKFYKEPPKVSILEGTPFYIGVLNLLYGLSKSGKSRSLAELLQKANCKNKTIVWLDKDYNVDPDTIKVLRSFKHVNENVDELCKTLRERPSLEEYILVFDSLKDFSHGLDSNAEAQNTMEDIRQFTKLGATVIVIAHATKWITPDGKKSGFKLQGNSETIQSKCDCVFRFEKTESKIQKDVDILIIIRKFIPDQMRISNASTEPILVYEKRNLTLMIHKLIDENNELTHRELKKKVSSSYGDVIDELEGEAYSIKEVGNKRVLEKIISSLS